LDWRELSSWFVISDPADPQLNMGGMLDELLTAGSETVSFLVDMLFGGRVGAGVLAFVGEGDGNNVGACIG
jgi:hypothetical protein